eukprot:CAMPEP_0174970820 /NCGR_PEP_ID=MMETSP0004_2-20121128/9630_1 /TAXON_ID=420556 /ORGANISM="Ochromonas sp., Strain CCMP1393" /LENGTH=267 /DNA_ID=CAMNT_0016220663 /DNA_START=357 /DNA_END=1156 /DNA_ORIENTATION=-
MSNGDCPPYILYQSVNLEPDLVQDTITASTTIWLGFKKPITVGSKIRLHCRQCKIKEIHVNNVASKFVLCDPLKMIASVKKLTYLAENLDLNYRAALEVSRAGELSITIPDINNSPHAKINLPHPIPRTSPKDVLARFDKLLRTYKSLTTPVRGSSVLGGIIHNNTDPAPAPGPTAPSTAEEVHEETGKHFLIQIRIIYSVSVSGAVSGSSSSGTVSAGCTFRHQPVFADLFRSTVDNDPNQEYTTAPNVNGDERSSSSSSSSSSSA